MVAADGAAVVDPVAGGPGGDTGEFLDGEFWAGGPVGGGEVVADAGFRFGIGFGFDIGQVDCIIVWGFRWVNRAGMGPNDWHNIVCEESLEQGDVVVGYFVGGCSRFHGGGFRCELGVSHIF